MKKKKIGILTCHYYPNFGSTLQAIALQNTILKMGYDVNIINYHNPKHGTITLKSLFIHFIKRTVSKLPFSNFRKYRDNCFEFQNKYQKTTRVAQTDRELKNIVKGFDVIVCGSDQIWSPAHFYKTYFAPFASGISKISYAPSIGTNNIPEELVDEYKKLLGQFKYISIREEKGKELLKDICGINSTVVLDPTLLLEKEDYYYMEETVLGIAEPFIFCYFLNAENTYDRNFIQQFANQNNCSIYGFSLNPKDGEYTNLLHNISAGNFLWLVKNAKAVFTDSYHGNILSLIYHTPFYLFMRFNSRDPRSENSRILQLDDYFKISSNLITESNNRIEDIPAYDFFMFENKRADLKEKSLNYLREALNNA